jgi:hypothetical protein
VLNFGALANITEPGVATTQLVAGDVDTYYTVVLDSVKVGNKTVASAASSRIIVDSGTMLTFLDPALMGPLIGELSRRITLPPMQSPDGLLQLCYEVAGREVEAGERITNHIDKHLYSTVESCSDNQSTYVERIVRYRNAKISFVSEQNNLKLSYSLIRITGFQDILWRRFRFLTSL